jgi:hypothetical protein
MRQQVVIGALIYLALALVLAVIIQTGTHGEPGTVSEWWDSPYCHSDVQLLAGNGWLSISIRCSW